MDMDMDRNDRTVGSVWGEGAAGARAVNYAASQMGRITSLTAFLSQWSSRSRADGPTNLARSRAPVLLCTYTADRSTFPSTRDAWITAAGGLGGGRIQAVDIVGGNHYLAGQPTLVEQTADAMDDAHPEQFPARLRLDHDVLERLFGHPWVVFQGHGLHGIATGIGSGGLGFFGGLESAYKRHDYSCAANCTSAGRGNQPRPLAGVDWGVTHGGPQ